MCRYRLFLTALVMFASSPAFAIGDIGQAEPLWPAPPPLAREMRDQWLHSVGTSGHDASETVQPSAQALPGYNQWGVGDVVGLAPESVPSAVGLLAQGPDPAAPRQHESPANDLIVSHKAAAPPPDPTETLPSQVALDRLSASPMPTLQRDPASDLIGQTQPRTRPQHGPESAVHLLRPPGS